MSDRGAPGFDITNDATLKNYDAEIKKLTEFQKNEINNYIDNLSVSDLLYIKYKITADPNSLTVEELQKKVSELKAASGEDVIPVKTYSSIIESIESVNEALSQTKEVILDDTEVTQEYKDS